MVGGGEFLARWWEMVNIFWVVVGDGGVFRKKYLFRVVVGGGGWDVV